jgi:hypothetical protein
MLLMVVYLLNSLGHGEARHGEARQGAAGHGEALKFNAIIKMDPV